MVHHQLVALAPLHTKRQVAVASEHCDHGVAGRGWLRERLVPRPHESADTPVEGRGGSCGRCMGEGAAKVSPLHAAHRAPLEVFECEVVQDVGEEFVLVEVFHVALSSP